MDIKLEKNLCAWGLISMTLLSCIPCLGFIFSLVGLVAYSIGIIKLSNKLNNKEISKNFFISVVIYITMIVIAYLIVFLLGITARNATSSGQGLFSFVSGTSLFIILLSYIGSVAGSFFIKKYLEIISQETKHQTFDLAGKIIFWGTILFILPSIIGWIIQIYAFFTVPENIESKNQ